MSNIALIAGTMFPALAEAVAKEFDGMELIKAQPLKSVAGETIGVEIGATVMGRDVFIIQTAAVPTVQALFEVLMIADVAVKQGASRIVLIAPYFFFPDMDVGHGDRRCVTLRLAVQQLQTTGITQIATFDLHNHNAAELMPKPIIDMRAAPVLAHYIRQHWRPELGDDLNLVMGVASSFGDAIDIGRVTRLLGIKDRVVIDRPKGGDPRILAGIGTSVEGRSCLVIDDVIRSGKTMRNTAQLLKGAGARSVSVVATHLAFPEHAMLVLRDAPIDRILVTNTLPIPDNVNSELGSRLHVVDISRYVAEVIRRICHGQRIENLWEDPESLAAILPRRYATEEG